MKSENRRRSGPRPPRRTDDPRGPREAPRQVDPGNASGGSPRLFLKPGREKSLLRRHPWIFSGAVERVEGSPASGATVAVRSSTGGFLGWGAYSPSSQILARIWDFHEGAAIDAAFFEARVRSACERRHRAFGDALPQAVRLVHGEADGLPGVVVDRFGDCAVVQLTSAGGFRWRDEIAAAVGAATGCRTVFERSDADVLQAEGLEPRVGLLAGADVREPVGFVENGLAFTVDVMTGHKTGFYLDQRRNRSLLRGLAAGADVLDCFCYTGGFALNAAAGGAASVTAIESSAGALAAAARHASDNGFGADHFHWMEGDVFALLRRFRDQGRQFDVIVLDPPKFAPSAALAERAARAYKDINLWALKLLRGGGRLLTFSCSGGVHRDLFQKIVAGAAVDANVDARILEHLGADHDHPVSLAFPEGDYLKGLLCEVG